MSPSVASGTPLTLARGNATGRDLVLCAVADDGAAMDVIATGAHLAAAGRVEVVFIHVAVPEDSLPIAQAALIGAVPAGELSALRAEAVHRAQALLERLGLGGAQTEIAVSPLPASELRAAARRLGASMIVVGPGPSGRLRCTFGYSVTKQLLRMAPCPVVVARSAEELQCADGPVIAALVGGGPGPLLSARWGARLGSLLDRSVVLARVGHHRRWVADIDVLGPTALQARVEAVVALAGGSEFGALADDVHAAAIAVPHPGSTTLGRILVRGRLARRLLARSRAPVAVLMDDVMPLAPPEEDAGAA